MMVTQHMNVAAKAEQIPDIRLTANAIFDGSSDNTSATQVNILPIIRKRGAPGG